MLPGLCCWCQPWNQPLACLDFVGPYRALRVCAAATLAIAAGLSALASERGFQGAHWLAISGILPLVG